ATQLRREVFDHVLELGVSAAFLQQIEQMLAERFVRIGFHGPSLLKVWLTGYGSARSVRDLRSFSSIDAGNAANDSAQGQRILLVGEEDFPRPRAAVVPAPQDGQMLHGFEGAG